MAVANVRYGQYSAYFCIIGDCMFVLIVDMGSYMITELMFAVSSSKDIECVSYL